MPRLSLPLTLLAAALAAPAASAQGYSAEDAVKRMTVADGLEVKLVAAEPLIRQPVTMTFDARGRLWVIQYLQYPTPEGLNPVAVDRYLRTTYDRMPEPPPKGPRGQDRVTILDDPDEDGRFRKAKDFVGGLNLATGLALGHGGVWVVQAPYLLFYPDKNGDDVPDADPEVHLTGFGMEDSHAFANSIQWGPDGWLYGAHGSTVTAKIKNPAKPDAPPIEFQQGVWRYHPRTHEFELFAEGGGNTWGLDFDAHGNVIAGTNFGGSAMLHQVQGGYYVKGFGKHGPLHNPHTYGYFEHVPYTGFKGGHVTCGGIVYHGGTLPKQYEGQYIAANPLSNAVHWHKMERNGSTFKASHGGEVLLGNDTWFRPIDCLVGPDGAVYVADWHDRRLNHVDPVDNWDRTNGRIYKIQAKGAPAPKPFDLAKLSSGELVKLLAHENQWYSREARRLLAERRDATIVPELKGLMKGPHALEALWALAGSGGVDEAFAIGLLKHANEDIRAWAVRLLGDNRTISDESVPHVILFASRETSPTVRSQLACTAKRLTDGLGLPLVGTLMDRKEDLADPHIPLLCWWAVEDKVARRPADVLSQIGNPTSWELPLYREFVAERLARRFMAERTDEGYEACTKLFLAAPEADRMALVRGMDKALEGRPFTQVPLKLEAIHIRVWDVRSTDPLLLRFAVRLGSEYAYKRAVSLVETDDTPAALRLQLVEALGQLGTPEVEAVLLRALGNAKNDPLRLAALAALQGFSNPKIAEAAITLYPTASSALRTRIIALAAGRLPSAKLLVEAVAAGRIKPESVPFDQVRAMLQHDDESLNQLLEKHWGRVSPATPGEKVARIASVNHMLNQRKGDPAAGRELFAKNCGNCHQLFGEGNKLAPDLTGADRKNREFLISQVVDPSAVIRPEYVAYLAETKDGRTLTGLIAEQTPQTVTLLDANNQRTTLDRDKIEELNPSPVSLMPEKILDPLNDDQIRDLFAFLQGDTPAKPQAKKDGKLVVCLVSGSLEYKSDESLAAYQEYLEKNFPVRCTRAFRKADDDLPGLENLETCDVALFYTRRLTIKGEQLDRVKKYVQSGKPIVAVRTASHGFQNWLAMDKEVLGGNYKSHFGAGPKCDVKITDKGKDHPVLKGVKPFTSEASLYRNTGLADDCELLMTGSIPTATEPLTWVRKHNGGRVFYTSLGHPSDFKDDNFLRMLTNALFWSAGRDAPAAAPAKGEGLKLNLRSRKLEVAANGGRDWKEIVKPEEWAAAETAIIVCDMWDKHWSKGATERVGIMAPKMDAVLKAARDKGVTIIHAPSETMAFYADHPARKRVLAAPKVAMPEAKKCESPPLPIDDSDGGSDTGEKPWYKAWGRQHPGLTIDGERDGISDNGQEVWNFLHQRGIKHVLVMGVHTNMCVLNRTFAIKQFVARGMPVALVRDLTDAMYNPERPPYVSHAEGTRLVVEYIEKFWCPSVGSEEFGK